MGFMSIFKKNNRQPEPTHQTKIEHKGEIVTSHKQISEDVIPDASTKNINMETPNWDTNISDLDAKIPPAEFSPLNTRDGGALFKVVTTFKPKPAFEKRNMIIVVVEDSPNVRSYITEITNLVNNIIKNNQDSFFWIINMGDKNIYSDIVISDSNDSIKLLEEIITTTNTCTNSVNLDQVLVSINEFVKDHLIGYRFIDYDKKKYKIDTLRILFIGSGMSDSDVIAINHSTMLLKILRTHKDITNIKYFCIKDNDAINVAALGFPVIGHIESNFYK